MHREAFIILKDKDSLIIDLAAYRSGQKLKALEEKFSNSIKDPAGFLTEVIYKYSLDLMQKIKTQPVYEEAFKILKTKKSDEMNWARKTVWGVFKKACNLLEGKLCSKDCR